MGNLVKARKVVAVQSRFRIRNSGRWAGLSKHSSERLRRRATLLHRVTLDSYSEKVKAGVHQNNKTALQWELSFVNFYDCRRLSNLQNRNRVLDKP